MLRTNTYIKRFKEGPRTNMNINIDIKEIAETAAWEYRAEGETELAHAPMVDIADYTAMAVDSYIENLKDELYDQLCDLVESEITK